MPAGYALRTPRGAVPSDAYWLGRMQARRGYVCTQCGHRSATMDAFRLHVADCPEVRRAQAPEREEANHDHDAA